MLRRWPALLGLAAAAFSAYGMTSGVDQATVLVAATVIYLGAAVLGKQSTAWPLFFGSIVVITAIRLINDDFQPSWVLFGIGAIFLVYGLARRMFEPAWGLPLQTIALRSGCWATPAWTSGCSGRTGSSRARWPSSASSWTPHWPC